MSTEHDENDRNDETTATTAVEDETFDDNEFASDREPHPLAWGEDGERLDVPDGADCWRVRRSTRRGAPELLYSDGAPLRLRLDSTIDDLAAAVEYAGYELPGRYRLDLLDARGKVIKGTACAVAEIKPPRGGGSQAAANSGGCASCGTTGGGAAVAVLSRNLDNAVHGVTSVAAQLAGAQSGVISAAAEAGITRRRHAAEPVVVEVAQPEPPAPAAPAPPAKAGWMQFLEALPKIAPALPQILQVLQGLGLVPPQAVPAGSTGAADSTGAEGSSGAPGSNGVHAAPAAGGA